MIKAEYYEAVYLIIVFILTLIVSSRYSVTYRDERKESPIRSLLLCAFMILFIGLRPVSPVFVDMMGYYLNWEDWDFGKIAFYWDQQSLLYDNLRILMSTSQISVDVFILLISIIYFGLMWWSCRRLFPNDTLFAFLVCLAAFSTFSYATNGIKAGSAASIFLLAIAYSDKKVLSFLLALISIGFHHSMIMVVGCYVVVCLINNPKYYFALWVVCLGLAAAHVTFFQSLFNSIVDEQGQMYLSEQRFGKGFRLDFIIYSAMPIIVGAYSVFVKKIRSKRYSLLLSLYLLTNSVWLLCMYAEFTNRIAYLSWFLYPVVLIYPFLKENIGPNRYITVRNISFFHIAFTMFMVFIFYS